MRARKGIEPRAVPACDTCSRAGSRIATTGATARRRLLLRPNTRFVALTLISVIVLTAAPLAQRSTQGRAFVTGEIIVKFRPGLAASEKASAHRMARGTSLMEIQRTGLQRIRVPAGEEAATIARYRRNPNVLYAEPNFLRTIPTPLAQGAASEVGMVRRKLGSA